MAVTQTTTVPTTPPLRAFHGDAELKRRLLVEIDKHTAADALVKGTYAAIGSSLPDGFKGCAIGCALHSLNTITGVAKITSDHSRFPTELGIPVELAYHIDAVFENLPQTESQTWPRRVIDAIPVGAELSGVVPALLQWMILDPQEGFIALAAERFAPTYRDFARLVAADWATPHSVNDVQWDAIDRALVDDPVWTQQAWAEAGAWTRARAEAWAWTRAWTQQAWAEAWARAEAWAWTRARAHSRLSAETIRLLQTAPVP